ncbi:uncharacterized protein BO66DRAFT_252089 [Aspergillus aculeatinus CBS 121060]|uniref:Uncharacterized protein n=1 Tax=Aspergillus aculeatinus CBS 121060 TaxID=1448322 RepID=A0ACD1HHB3_9EURO|nr:hypothetical protein BO66DRAFT_252089 [Aspergillus aculeatinus CBS 121060]RAH73019.1 hypothetical protein BO66DRAFT_252089 [Aspergillus aculeatinus CBS 121060]
MQCLVVACASPGSCHATTYILERTQLVPGVALRLRYVDPGPPTRAVTAYFQCCCCC